MTQPITRYARPDAGIDSGCSHELRRASDTDCLVCEKCGVGVGGQLAVAVAKWVAINVWLVAE